MYLEIILTFSPWLQHAATCIEVTGVTLGVLVRAATRARLAGDSKSR